MAAGGVAVDAGIERIGPADAGAAVVGEEGEAVDGQKLAELAHRFAVHGQHLGMVNAQGIIALLCQAGLFAAGAAPFGMHRPEGIVHIGWLVSVENAAQAVFFHDAAALGKNSLHAAGIILVVIGLQRIGGEDVKEGGVGDVPGRIGIGGIAAKLPHGLGKRADADVGTAVGSGIGAQSLKLLEGFAGAFETKHTVHG